MSLWEGGFMEGSLAAKYLFDHWMQIATLCIAGVVGLITIGQYVVNKERLRLDLYNRRFDIYSRALSFYHALLKFDPAKKRDNFDLLQNEFIRGYRESQFLFDKKDGVYDMLGEMHSRSFKIIGFRERGGDLLSTPEYYLKMQQEMLEAMRWFNETAIFELERRIARYLYFPKVTR
jgi:hypothetical protein